MEAERVGVCVRIYKYKVIKCDESASARHRRRRMSGGWWASGLTVVVGCSGTRAEGSCYFDAQLDYNAYMRTACKQ